MVSNQLLAVVPPLLLAVNTTVITAVGALRVIDGQITIGTLVAFQALMLSFLAPVSTLVVLGGTLQEVGGNINRLDDVLHNALEPRLANGETDVADDGSKLGGQLDLRNVTFGYSPYDAPLLEGFNLHLKPGARVALIGGSGSGKSTVARLVAGLHQPWQGEVCFDGVAAEHLPLSQLARSLSMVSQHIDQASAAALQTTSFFALA